MSRPPARGPTVRPAQPVRRPPSRAGSVRTEPVSSSESDPLDTEENGDHEGPHTKNRHRAHTGVCSGTCPRNSRAVLRPAPHPTPAHPARERRAIHKQPRCQPASRSPSGYRPSVYCVGPPCASSLPAPLNPLLLSQAHGQQPSHPCLPLTYVPVPSHLPY